MSFSDLSNREKRAFWSEVERNIREVLDSLSPAFPNPDREQVIDYLAHNELGLALEHLCDAILEEELSIGEPELTTVSRLFEQMELEPHNRLQALASRRLTSR